MVWPVVSDIHSISSCIHPPVCLHEVVPLARSISRIVKSYSPDEAVPTYVYEPLVLYNC